jgi:hypothetical protein
MNFLNRKIEKIKWTSLSHKITKWVLPVIIVSFAMSCSDDNDAVDSEDQQLDYSEVLLESQMDRASEAMDDIALDVYETQETSESNRSVANFNLPDCVTITVVLEQNSREITIDFGDGCEVNGNTLQGQILLTYERNPDAQQVFMTKSLVDFYFNELSINGTKTFLKELSNDNGNPQFTKTLNITVVWPNGAEASREGTKVREWIEGAFSGIFSDNVFEITGNWTANFVNGNTHTYQVLEPLRREVICYYFVSGNVDVERTNFSGVLDYGQGDCDNQATFTFDNGEEVSVTLN